MPKPSTFPTLYDECKQISISFLKSRKYLTPGTNKSGTITWSRNGEETGWINIAVNTHSVNPYLELNYNCNGNPVNYRVPLVNIPSNLGKGVVWYFLCPATGKRCRKLYLIREKFLHREAYRGCMYEIQTHSHKSRQLIRIFDKAFVTDKVYKQLYSKYFKTHYAGKPTKRYLRLKEKIWQSEQFTLEEKERLYLP